MWYEVSCNLNLWTANRLKNNPIYNTGSVFFFLEYTFFAQTISLPCFLLCFENLYIKVVLLHCTVVLGRNQNMNHLHAGRVSQLAPLETCCKQSVTFGNLCLTLALLLFCLGSALIGWHWDTYVAICLIHKTTISGGCVPREMSKRWGLDKL